MERLLQAGVFFRRRSCARCDAGNYSNTKTAELLAMLTSAYKDEREAAKKQVRKLIKLGLSYT